MPYRRHSPAQKAEAIALGVVLGAEEAASQLGYVDRQTLRRWMEKAGKKPGDAIETDGWGQLMDLALAKVTSLVASGKLPAATIATVAGIAARNRRKPEPLAEGESAVTAREIFLDWVIDTIDELEPSVGSIRGEADMDAHVVAVSAAIDQLPAALLRLANAETGFDDPPSPHRVALLAWFSGRPEQPAGDVLEWAKAHTRQWTQERGGLLAWHRWQKETAEAERIERDRQHQERRRAREQAERAALDAETQALVAAAEAFLQESADAVQ